MGMRAILTGVSVSFVAFGVANAADIGPGGLKDAPYVETVYAWTGVYGGLTAGYGWGTSKNYVSNNNNPHGWAENDPDGFAIGGTIGYNYQFAPTWVVGAEADFSWMNLQGQQGMRIYDGHYWSGGWDGLLTLRARLGYTVGTTMFYGTAGYAAMHSNEIVAGNDTDEADAATGWRNGWVVGAGVEHKFTDRWSVKAEYLHADFEDLSGATGYPGNYSATQVYKMESSLDLFRLGVNYKF